MQLRTPWTSQEDQNLKLIVQSAQDITSIRGIDWYMVSQKLKKVLSVYKTAKQCKDRWNNHLQPGYTKESEWTHQEQTSLFELQDQLGNKWRQIASKLPNKTDVAVKNYFYATLRRSIRLLNGYIAQHRNQEPYRNFKPFPENCIGKIIAQEQNKKSRRMKVTKDNISLSARHIKYLLLEISRNPPEKDSIQQAIHQISEFNKSCRRIRCKKTKGTQQFQNIIQTEKTHSSFYSLRSRTEKEQNSRIKQKQSISTEPKTGVETVSKNQSTLLTSMNQIIFKECSPQRVELKQKLRNKHQPNYLYDCHEDILLVSSENYRSQSYSQQCSQKQRDRSNSRVYALSQLKNQSQHRVQQILELPSLFLQNQEFRRNSQLLFQNDLQGEQYMDQFGEEYL